MGSSLKDKIKIKVEAVVNMIVLLEIYISLFLNITDQAAFIYNGEINMSERYIKSEI